jgi:hypothetical protein
MTLIAKHVDVPDEKPGFESCVLLDSCSGADDAEPAG